MNNKRKQLKIALAILAYTLLLIGAFCVINRLEYMQYSKNYNQKVSSVCEAIKSRYPEISDRELIELLNSDDEESKLTILDRYGIDIENDSILLANDKIYQEFMLIRIIAIVLLMAAPTVIFLFVLNKRNKEIDEITKYVESINKGDYSLKIDNNTEDGMSILKNEVYKSTIMLKEAAENSKKDKLLLKDSLSDISHQLKTPITSLTINLDNLENLESDQAEGYSEENVELRNKFIMNSRREVAKISFLVQTLLKFSKLDANTITFIRKEVKLRALIDTCVDNISSLADLLGIKVTITEIVDDGSLLLCDESWQCEAITNILKNAVEHATSYVEIKYECCSSYKKISVTNDGKPISVQDKKHIFERFYRGENSKKDSVGIGLAMAKTIIEQDGGFVVVESDEKKENSGATFTIKY